jgi:hypothetical protein
MRRLMDLDGVQLGCATAAPMRKAQSRVELVLEGLAIDGLPTCSEMTR